MLLPRYRQDEPAHGRPRRITDKLREITTRDTDTAQVVQAGPLTDDPMDKRRRGIPIIGGVTGTQPGSDPLLEAIRNDHRRRYGNAA